MSLYPLTEPPDLGDAPEIAPAEAERIDDQLRWEADVREAIGLLAALSLTCPCSQGPCAHREAASRALAALAPARRLMDELRLERSLQPILDLPF